MPLNIAGIEVDFPYEPYECQLKFMESVINALKNGENALLESPTGTGKTLSLLCATLAYVKAKKEQFKLNASNLQAAGVQNQQPVPAPAYSERLFPQIIYASRTHSQLNQVVRELNKTSYRSSIQVAFLAGREQLCLDPRVQKEQNTNTKSQVCRTLVRSYKCSYHNLLPEDTDELKKLYSRENDGKALDLEDMVRVGHKLHQCPFYRVRRIQPTADLILLPYTYILDPKIRQIFDLKLNNNILIFDEAHNINNIAEESMSMSISTATIAICIRELKAVLEAMVDDEEQVRSEAETKATPLHILEQQQKEDKENQGKRIDDRGEMLKKEDVAELLERMLKLDEKLADFWKNPPENQGKVEHVSGRVFPGETLVQLLNSAEIVAGNANRIGALIDRIGMFWMKKEHESENSGGIFAKKVAKLPDFSYFVSCVFALGAQVTDENVYDLFRLYVTAAEQGDGFVLSYWCFSPQVAMRYLEAKKPLSIILASGTLSPIENFVQGMGIPFPHVLENGHAAKPDQVLVRPLRYDSNKVELIGNFQNRESAAYMNAIGEVIYIVASAAPQGMLVFFASYAQMNKFISSWKIKNKHGISRWDTLVRTKHICIEPSNRSETQFVFREFDTEVRQGKGAIMFAVCRGKMSEGIDFADCHARAVVVVGIPYPPLYDARIILKKKFLNDRILQKKNEVTASEWYQTEAIRTVNQALGRIIRHKDDFGIVVLADSRFQTLPMSVYPAWIRQSIRNENDPMRLFKEVERFFIDRKLLVERSQQDAYKGALVIHERRTTSTIQQKSVQSRDEGQWDEFLVTAKLYGFDANISSTEPSTSKSILSKPDAAKPSQSTATFAAPKRKPIKLLPNNSRSSAAVTGSPSQSQQPKISNFFTPPRAKASSSSSSPKEPESKRTKTITID